MFWAFMELEEAYDRIDRDGLWNILLLSGLGGTLLRDVKKIL